MLELFNVKNASDRKIAAGPFADKKAAKVARDQLNPAEQAEAANLPYVVTYGKDHFKYGRKHTQTSGGGKKFKK